MRQGWFSLSLVYNRNAFNAQLSVQQIRTFIVEHLASGVISCSRLVIHLRYDAAAAGTGGNDYDDDDDKGYKTFR